MSKLIGFHFQVCDQHFRGDRENGFFDNCWEYYNGRSETWLGRALKGRRDKVFLMTKVCTHGRGKDIAMRMLEESLKRLQTDHLDLWQAHAMGFDNDPALAYAKGGVLEAFELAKKQGKVRFVGFTGHKDPLVHLEMIRRGYSFDTVQMPLNPFDWSFHSFEKLVLPEANKRGIAPFGMKSMGGAADAIKKGFVTGEELLNYAMSLPVSVTIVGMDSLKVLRKNVAIARREFSQIVALSPALVAASVGNAADDVEPIPRRLLGKTGEKVSVLGLGGYHIGKTASLKVAANAAQNPGPPGTGSQTGTGT